MSRPRIVIIAGPKGAGKTTFARTFLPKEAQVIRFINADLIAVGLSPFSPESASFGAARVMLNEITGCARRLENFAFETTLAGLGYVRHINSWRKAGYHVTLYFLTLPAVEMAIARVAERVRQGGHNVEEDVIKRRFDAGLKNFARHYRPIVDTWALFDNSAPCPVQIEWGDAR